MQEILLRNTHQFSKFICDFTEQKNEFSFLPSNYFSKTYIENLIAERKINYANRNILTQVLTEQYSTIETENAVKNSLLKLKNENCFTVTTAHQPCFFGGPLYTILKAITAIKIAEQYKKDFPENDFVPVYYIGSEDHDLEELNHFYLFNKKIEWQTEQGGAVGSMSINSIENVITELESLLKNEEKKDEIIALLKKSYQPEITMAKAFRLLLNELLGKFGLIILDANDKRFKQSFISIFKDDLLNNSAFKLLNKKKWLQHFTNNELQILPREINQFYLKENARERIVFDGESYSSKNAVFKIDKESIENFIEQNTGNISPNVVLRPLYQSTILPDVAFTGGGSEVTYWLQLKTIFDFYKISFPQIFLRDSVLLVDKNADEKRLKWDFSLEEIFDDINFLIKKFTEKSGALNIESEKEKFLNDLNQLQQKITNHDKGLASSSAAILKQIENSISQLQQKISQNDKKKLSDSIAQIEKWKQKLLPDEHLQERKISFIELYLKHGKSFVDKLYNSFNPFQPTLKIIEL